jgi:hypothetical protein
MSAYVIARRYSEFLDTPVFYAGSSGQEEAVAAFTDRKIAELYIDDAAWGDEYEVGELDPLQLLHWIVTVHTQGTQYLAVNPERRSHLAGTEQEIVVIEEMLAAFAESLTRDILSLAQRDPGQAGVL